MAISAYDDNQFAYRKPTRHQTMASAERKMKRRLPLWLDILIIHRPGRRSAAGWILTHPSAHRSPGTIATDFAVQVGGGNYTAAAQTSTLPTGRRSKTMRRTQECQAASSPAPTPPSWDLDCLRPTASVVVQACNASLACNNLPAIPCIEINGLWYVAWTPLLQSLRPHDAADGQHVVEAHFNGVSLGALVAGAEGSKTWAHDLDLSVGDNGITVGGSEGAQASTLPWSAVRQFAPGFTLSFPDGRPATELEVALADRSL